MAERTVHEKRKRQRGDCLECLVCVETFGQLMHERKVWVIRLYALSRLICRELEASPPRVGRVSFILESCEGRHWPLPVGAARTGAGLRPSLASFACTSRSTRLIFCHIFRHSPVVN